MEVFCSLNTIIVAAFKQKEEKVTPIRVPKFVNTVDNIYIK